MCLSSVSCLPCGRELATLRIRPTKVVKETVSALEMLTDKKSSSDCRLVFGKDGTCSGCNSCPSGCQGRDVDVVGLEDRSMRRVQLFWKRFKGFVNQRIFTRIKFEEMATCSD